MAELLLELFSEEIPARMQARAEDDLAKNVLDRLKEAGISWTPGSVKTCSSPQRLVLRVDGLPPAQPDVIEEKRGPRVGAPDAAIQGFLKSAGLASLDQCERRETDKGEFWFAVVEKKGISTRKILERIVPEIVVQFPWLKTMRWGSSPLRWVRPLKRILSLFDDEPFEVVLEPASLSRLRSMTAAMPLGLIGNKHPHDIPFGKVTHGHRFCYPQEIVVSDFADYKMKLRQSNVIVDPTERRGEIERRAHTLAESEGLQVRHDPDLLDEVAGLVEWPVALIGRIDDTFMQLPPEVLTTTMRVNQKYFSLLDTNGKLVPRFIVITNIEAKDGGKAIVAGNERVLRARLSDAKFFWDQDRKVKLEERVPALKDIIFHARLGTVADKVARIQTLAAELVPHIRGADVDQVRNAALLAKADLTSGMVGEFPELQGVMGRYYAMHEGEKQAVADAIAEHYAPRYFNDRCPTAPVSVAVALADKIDSLVGFFAIDERPTGSKDPFALRRAALGIIRLIVENKLRLPLRQVFMKAYRPIGFYLEGESSDEFDYVLYLSERHLSKEELEDENIEIHWEHGLRSRAIEAEGRHLAGELLDFLADRLKVALREKGVRHDLISAVFALTHDDDLVRLLARVDALRTFLGSEDGTNLLTAYRRANKIVRIEEQRDNTEYAGDVDVAQLVDPVERQALKANNDVRASVAESIKNDQFIEAMAALAKLRKPVDEFFDKVTVNCEDAALRANRLRLLSEIRATLNRVADFSQIEG